MKTIYFFAGLLLAGLAWWIFWPEDGKVVREEGKAPVVPSRERLNEILQRARNSHGDPQVYRDLETLSASQLKEELKLIHENGGLKNPDEFTEGLLLALAHKDYREAFLWTYALFENSWEWQRCFEVMGPEWGARDPEGFVLFLDDLANKKITGPGKSLPRILNPENVEALRLLPLWLVDHNPRQAFQLAHLTNSRAKNDRIDLIEKLQDPEDFAAALSAWQEPDPTFTGELRRMVAAGTTKHPPQLFFYVRGVIGKWKESDPGSFMNSDFATWDSSRRP